MFEVLQVLPKWNRNSLNSANRINHINMNWAQFKDPVKAFREDSTVFNKSKNIPKFMHPLPATHRKASYHIPKATVQRRL